MPVTAEKRKTTNDYKNNLENAYKIMKGLGMTDDEIGDTLKGQGLAAEIVDPFIIAKKILAEEELKGQKEEQTKKKAKKSTNSKKKTYEAAPNNSKKGKKVETKHGLFQLVSYYWQNYRPNLTECRSTDKTGKETTHVAEIILPNESKEEAEKRKKINIFFSQVNELKRKILFTGKAVLSLLALFLLIALSVQFVNYLQFKSEYSEKYFKNIGEVKVVKMPLKTSFFITPDTINPESIEVEVQSPGLLIRPDKTKYEKYFVSEKLDSRAKIIKRYIKSNGEVGKYNHVVLKPKFEIFTRKKGKYFIKIAIQGLDPKDITKAEYKVEIF